jgi:hypothetical protein
VRRCHGCDRVVTTHSIAPGEGDAGCAAVAPALRGGAAAPSAAAAPRIHVRRLMPGESWRDMKASVRYRPAAGQDQRRAYICRMLRASSGTRPAARISAASLLPQPDER